MRARPNDSGIGDSGVHTGGESLERQTHAAADRLASQIPALCDARGALPAQMMLAQELGVSRALLREAVTQLVARRELHVAILAASTNPFLQQLTCLVPPPEETADPDAGAPAISDGEPDGEHQALVLLEAAIHNGDPAAAHAGVVRLNGWDLPRERDAYGHPESVGASA
ncbi:GntR family transcriptional regulator [Paraburkholderia sacchari]|uniref:GntR family transcriptional regulator n=1 Tax=Paraburkholderia sacchari TaxID=159450 RepID=UPI002467BAA5|nr:GntR family transcriptional regulator [Paraburkholderia sacchari]